MKIELKKRKSRKKLLKKDEGIERIVSFNLPLSIPISNHFNDVNSILIPHLLPQSNINLTSHKNSKFQLDKILSWLHDLFNSHKDIKMQLQKIQIKSLCCRIISELNQ